MFGFLAALKKGEVGREEGQTLVLFALGLIAFMGLVGLSIDVGRLVYMRTDLQKTADAAAFAGSQELPSSSTAIAIANDYVTQNNGSASANVTVFTTHGTNDSITVVASRDVGFSFMRALGFTSHEVSARATVRVGTYKGGAGLLPFGLVANDGSDPDDESNSTLLHNGCFSHMDGDMPVFDQNTTCTLKYGAGTNTGGDFGALGLDGTGADIYRDTIVNGTTSTFRKGDQVIPETGNMNGPTHQGIDDRLASARPAKCQGDTEGEILSVNDDDTVTILPGCESHPRIAIIPVVDQIDNPEPTTILGFAYVFITELSGGGGHSQLKVKFVSFMNEIPGGVYEGWDGGAQAVFLVE